MGVAFVHSHPAPPSSEDQCREDRIAAELSKQRMETLGRLAGSSFEDPVRGGCKGRERRVVVYSSSCFVLVSAAL